MTMAISSTMSRGVTASCSCHKREIAKLIGKTKEKGFTLVPLTLYFSHGLVKVKLALATGKKLYDKRRDMADRSAKREIDRALKSRNR